MSNQTVTLNVNINGKSMIVAYLLWWFLGTLGVHRFYLGRAGTGIVQLLLFVLGVITAAFIVGYVLLLAWFLWWALDAYFTQKIVSQVNAELGLSSSEVSFSKSGDVYNELDQLEKLHSLFEKGVLTKDQYESKKSAFI